MGDSLSELRALAIASMFASKKTIIPEEREEGELYSDEDESEKTRQRASVEIVSRVSRDCMGIRFSKEVDATIEAGSSPKSCMDTKVEVAVSSSGLHSQNDDKDIPEANTDVPNQSDGDDVPHSFESNGIIVSKIEDGEKVEGNIQETKKADAISSSVLSHSISETNSHLGLESTAQVASEVTAQMALQSISQNAVQTSVEAICSNEQRNAQAEENDRHEKQKLLEAPVDIEAEIQNIDQSEVSNPSVLQKQDSKEDEKEGNFLLLKETLASVKESKESKVVGVELRDVDGGKGLTDCIVEKVEKADSQVDTNLKNEGLQVVSLRSDVLNNFASALPGLPSKQLVTDLPLVPHIPIPSKAIVAVPSRPLSSNNVPSSVRPVSTGDTSVQKEAEQFLLNLGKSLGRGTKRGRKPPGGERFLITFDDDDEDEEDRPVNEKPSVEKLLSGTLSAPSVSNQPTHQSTDLLAEIERMRKQIAAKQIAAKQRVGSKRPSLASRAVEHQVGRGTRLMPTGAEGGIRAIVQVGKTGGRGSGGEAALGNGESGQSLAAEKDLAELKKLIHAKEAEVLQLRQGSVKGAPKEAESQGHKLHFNRSMEKDLSTGSHGKALQLQVQPSVAMKGGHVQSFNISKRHSPPLPMSCIGNPQTGASLSVNGDHMPSLPIGPPFSQSGQSLNVQIPIFRHGDGMSIQVGAPAVLVKETDQGKVPMEQPDVTHEGQTSRLGSYGDSSSDIHVAPTTHGNVLEKDATTEPGPQEARSFSVVPSKRAGKELETDSHKLKRCRGNSESKTPEMQPGLTQSLLDARKSSEHRNGFQNDPSVVGSLTSGKVSIKLDMVDASLQSGEREQSIEIPTLSIDPLPIVVSMPENNIAGKPFFSGHPELDKDCADVGMPVTTENPVRGDGRQAWKTGIDSPSGASDQSQGSRDMDIDWLRANSPTRVGTGIGTSAKPSEEVGSGFVQNEWVETGSFLGAQTGPLVNNFCRPTGPNQLQAKGDWASSHPNNPGMRNLIQPNGGTFGQFVRDGKETCDPQLGWLATSAIENVPGSISSMQHEANIRQLRNEEEALEQSLEEAQQERRRLEVRERLARRALRDAEIALLNVNSRCSFLIQRREALAETLHSAKMMHSISGLPPNSRCDVVPGAHGTSPLSHSHISGEQVFPMRPSVSGTFEQHQFSGEQVFPMRPSVSGTSEHHQVSGGQSFPMRPSVSGTFERIHTPGPTLQQTFSQPLQPYTSANETAGTKFQRLEPTEPLKKSDLPEGKISAGSTFREFSSVNNSHHQYFPTREVGVLDGILKKGSHFSRNNDTGGFKPGTWENEVFSSDKRGNESNWQQQNHVSEGGGLLRGAHVGVVHATVNKRGIENGQDLHRKSSVGFRNDISCAGGVSLKSVLQDCSPAIAEVGPTSENNKPIQQELLGVLQDVACRVLEAQDTVNALKVKNGGKDEDQMTLLEISSGSKEPASLTFIQAVIPDIGKSLLVEERDKNMLDGGEKVGLPDRTMTVSAFNSGRFTKEKSRSAELSRVPLKRKPEVSETVRGKQSRIETRDGSKALHTAQKTDEQDEINRIASNIRARLLQELGSKSTIRDKGERLLQAGKQTHVPSDMQLSQGDEPSASKKTGKKADVSLPPNFLLREGKGDKLLASEKMGKKVDVSVSQFFLPSEGKSTVAAGDSHLKENTPKDISTGQPIRVSRGTGQSTKAEAQIQVTGGTDTGAVKTIGSLVRKEGRRQVKGRPKDSIDSGQSIKADMQMASQSEQVTRGTRTGHVERNGSLDITEVFAINQENDCVTSITATVVHEQLKACDEKETGSLDRLKEGEELISQQEAEEKPSLELVSSKMSPSGTFSYLPHIPIIASLAPKGNLRCGIENHIEICMETPATEMEQAGIQMEIPRSRYQSPLLCFRSFKYCPRFKNIWGHSSTSATWSNVVDPNKVLCKFERRGRCNDKKCPFQHIPQYLDDDDTWWKLPKDVGVGEENALNWWKKAKPFYGTCAESTTAVQIENTVQGGLSGESEMLIPTYFIGMEMDLNFATDLGTGKSAVEKLCVQLSALRRELPAKIQKIGDCNGMKRQFFLSSSIDFGGKELEEDTQLRYYKDHSGFLARAEDKWELRFPWATLWGQARVQNDSKYVEGWLDLALCHINFSISPKLPSDGRDQALRVLARGLEANPQSNSIWSLYLVLYRSHEGSENTLDNIIMSAVEYNKGSYEVWRLLVDNKPVGEQQAQSCERALHMILLNSTESPEFLSALVLDFSLRLLHIHFTAGSATVALDWLRKLKVFLINYKEGPEKTEGNKQLEGGCILSLVLERLNGPDAVVLCVCSAYVCLFKQLQTEIIDRLGYHQARELPICLAWRHNGTEEEKEGRTEFQTEVRSLALDILSFGRRYVEDRHKDDVSHGLWSGCIARGLSLGTVLGINFLQALVFLEGNLAALAEAEKLLKDNQCCVELLLVYTEIVTRCSSLGFEESKRFWDTALKMSFQMGGCFFRLVWHYSRKALIHGGPGLAQEILGTVVGLQKSEVSDTEKVKEALTAHMKRRSELDERAYGFLCLSFLEVLHGHGKLAWENAEESLKVALEIGCRTYIRETLFECRMLVQMSVQTGSLVKETKVAESSKLKVRLLGCLLNSLLLSPSSRKNAFPPLNQLSQLSDSVQKPRVVKVLAGLLDSPKVDFSLAEVLWDLDGATSWSYIDPTTEVFFAEGILEIMPSNATFACRFAKHIECRASFKDTKGFGQGFARLYWITSLLVGTLVEAEKRRENDGSLEKAWLEAGLLLDKHLKQPVIARHLYSLASELYPTNFVFKERVTALEQGIEAVDTIGGEGKGLSIVDNKSS